jgi:NAD(P)-dependent dehydrogenase (short-subunit alcohol dehydrogenase family)
MSLTIRRVVTGHDENGRAIVLIDENSKNVAQTRPGAQAAVIWTSEGFPVDNDGSADTSGRKVGSTLDNGIVFRVVSFGPGVTPRNHRTNFAFNNAGIEQVPTPFLEQDEETFDSVVDINAKGVWLSMKYEIPAMLKTGGGSIVNTASVFGVIGIPGNEIYIASKHAVIGLTKSAAVEFGKQGIRVNAVLPGVIDTDMFQRFAGEKPEFRSQMSALQPIGRIGKAEEIADAAIWLSSSKSSFVTGHSLMVDGGYTAQ